MHIEIKVASVTKATVVQKRGIRVQSKKEKEKKTPQRSQERDMSHRRGKRLEVEGAERLQRIRESDCNNAQRSEVEAGISDARNEKRCAKQERSEFDCPAQAGC